MNAICPKCLADETIRVDVNDGDTLTCAGCDEEFTVSDLETLFESWATLLPWLKSHPARTAEAAAAASK